MTDEGMLKGPFAGQSDITREIRDNPKNNNNGIIYYCLYELIFINSNDNLF